MTCEERIAALEAIVLKQAETIANLTNIVADMVRHGRDASETGNAARCRRYRERIRARDAGIVPKQDSSADHAHMDIDATFFHKSNPVANPQEEKPVENWQLPPRKPAAREMRLDDMGQGLLDLMDGHPMPLDGPGCQRLVNLARDAKPDVTLPEISQAVNVAYERKKRIQTSGGLFLHTVPPILKTMAKRDPFEAFADENFPLWRRLMSDRTRAELAWEDRNAA